MKEKELERERMAIYEEIRSKPRMSPLLELIEPTHDRRGEEKEGNMQEDQQQQVMKMFDHTYQPSQYPGLIASTESLAEGRGLYLESDQTQTLRKKNRNEKKIRFNPYDEFSD